jgi:periplasmic protein CpxP/Spy
MARLFDTLTLVGVTDHQKAQLKAVLQKHRPTLQPLVQRYAAERGTLRSLIRQDVFDESAIRNQAFKIAALEADLAVERARIAQEARGILTSDQIEKLKAVESRREARMDKFLSRISGGQAEEYRRWADLKPLSR